MRNAKVFHGGHGPGGKFSTPGGAVSGSDTIALCWANEGNLNVGDEIPAATIGSSWSLFAPFQGWYFSEQWTLKELHFLFNDFTTFNPSMDITIQIRRRLADGTNPTPIVVAQVTTQFPQMPGSGQYFGNSNTGLSVAVPAGYYTYGYVSARSTTDNDGVSIWGRFQKG